MKLLYIANSRIPTDKAHGFQIMKMCEVFSNVGIEVELWAPRRFNPIKENPFRYYNIRETFKIRKIFVVDFILLSKYLGAFANFAESITFALFSLFNLSRAAADTIYTRDQFSGWFLSFFNKKFVYEIHSFPKNFRVYKRIWRRAHKIIVVTEGLKNFLVKNGVEAKKILVAPDAVDLAAWSAAPGNKEELRIELGLPNRDSFLIGYVGKFKTLGMEKGIKTMIEALPLLDKEAKMVFVGGEELEIKDYKNLASRFNVSTRCVFVGFEPRVRAVKYTKAMDALIIPFPNMPHYAFYASPLKLFEYMASSRPIIASDLPALREILNDKNALFFKPGDASDLARVIKMLVSSKTLGLHLSWQALADVKEYTWDKRAQKIWSFIK